MTSQQQSSFIESAKRVVAIEQAAIAALGERFDERFVKACVEAYDEGRIRCLLDATTTEDALACRAGRVPPG